MKSKKTILQLRVAVGAKRNVAGGATGASLLEADITLLPTVNSFLRTVNKRHTLFLKSNRPVITPRQATKSALCSIPPNAG